MSQTNRIRIIIWTFTFISCSMQFVFPNWNALSLNDACEVERTKVTGQCTFIEDCPDVEREIWSRGFFPQLCGFVNSTKEIICCPENAEAPKVGVPEVPGVPKMRISQKKCFEYSEYSDLPAPEMRLSTTLETGRNACEIITSNVIDRILSQNDSLGDNDLPGLMTYPHMALLGYDTPSNDDITWACGGSLISDKHILTAAHCIKGPTGLVKYVLLGELDTSTDDDIASPLLFNVAERIVHPKYSKKAAKNDIALLVLNETVQFDSFMSPACLHDSREIDTTKVIATGWGENINHTRDPHLQEVDLDLLETSYCQKEFKKLVSSNGKSDLDDKSQICAGSLRDGKDTCVGDSGGPLQIYHPTLRCMFSLVGVTSFGWPNCGFNKPGVYTRVYHYLDWIEGIVWPKNFTAA